MSRTPFIQGGAKPQQNAPLVPRANHEAAPRVSMAYADKYHANCDITVLGRPVQGVDGVAKAFEFECLASGKKFIVFNVEDEDKLTLTVELTLRLHPGGTSGDLYQYDLVNMTPMNDDFDVERYKKLLLVIQQNKGLFFDETS